MGCTRRSGSALHDAKPRVRQRAGDDARILRKPFDGHVLAQWVEAACGQQ